MRTHDGRHAQPRGPRHAKPKQHSPNRRRNTLGTIFLAMVLTLVFGAPTATADSEPDCRTVSTQLVDRPDSAVGGGTWALDALTRTVEICEVGPADVEATHGFNFSVYEATLTDVGTFETLALDHTPGGAPQDLPSGVPGTVNGGAKYKIIAGSNWIGFDPSGVDGQTFNDSDGPSTGEWVLSMFGPYAKEKTEVFGSTWSWTYTTCAEQWVNQAADLGGNSGDITGLPCDVAVEITIQPDCFPQPFEVTVTNPEGNFVDYEVALGDGGETVTLEPGDSTSVESTTNVPVTVDDEIFTVVEYPAVPGCPGEPGAPGDQGPKGDTGDQGPTGETPADEDDDGPIAVPTRINTGR